LKQQRDHTRVMATRRHRARRFIASAWHRARARAKRIRATNTLARDAIIARERRAGSVIELGGDVTAHRAILPHLHRALAYSAQEKSRIGFQ